MFLVADPEVPLDGNLRALLIRYCRRLFLMSEVPLYRGTSLSRKRNPLGSYRRSLGIVLL